MLLHFEVLTEPVVSLIEIVRAIHVELQQTHHVTFSEAHSLRKRTSKPKLAQNFSTFLRSTTILLSYHIKQLLKTKSDDAAK